MGSEGGDASQHGRHEADAVLARRAAAGDAAAARRIVDAHLGTVVRFSHRMLGDAAEAEDVAQEAFARLWSRIGSWEPRAALGTWLCRVAHNLCVDRLRARRTVAVDDLPDPEDPSSEAGALLERREAARAVARAIGELPERQRAAIALVYYEGLSNRAAAEALDVDVDALESLLARARRTLRDRMGDPGATNATSRAGNDAPRAPRTGEE